MQIYHIPFPDDQVKCSNYNNDMVEDGKGNETITKNARDKIGYYLQRKWKLARNFEIAYSVVYGQCSETL